MNPEFERNLWLEATPVRLGLMAGFLLLAFLAAGTVPFVPAQDKVGLFFYGFIVVLWGTRNAALGVVGEIRERTWDAQKLSSLQPSTMMWGKLLGATSYNWFGGLICLPFILWPVFRDQGVAAMATEALILVVLGLQAQAVSLLASLNLVRRQNNNWRLDTFLCQMAGIAAVLLYWGLWDGQGRESEITLYWWRWAFNARDFHIASLCAFTAWALVGCYRAMRVELRFENGPFVWLAYLVFLALYSAGFVSWIESQTLKPAMSLLTGGDPRDTLYRLLIVALTLSSTAYGMVVIEVKDPVRLRWLAEKLGQGHLVAVFLRLDAWMLSYAATLLAGLALALGFLLDTGLGGGHRPLALQAWTILAMLGFLSRDMGIFLVLRSWSRHRGDLGALAVLAALHLLAPAILRQTPLVALFQVNLLDPQVLPALLAWAEAAGVAVVAVRRLKLSPAMLNAG